MEPQPSPMIRNTLKQQKVLREIYHKANKQTYDSLEQIFDLIQNYKQRSPLKQYQIERDEHDLLYDALLKCMMLCHQARPVYQQYKSDQVSYESFQKNEEIALQLAQLCGYSLERFNRADSPDEYFCKIQGNLIKYKILGLNQYTESRCRNSIIVQCAQSSVIALYGGKDYAALKQLCGIGSGKNSILICKGDYEALSDLIDATQKEREEFEQILKSYKQRGVRMIIYATRELGEKETQQYESQYNLLRNSLTVSHEQLEQLALQYERDLNILGIIGFKEELKPDAYEFIKKMQQSQIVPWILSGDIEASVMSCAQALQINQCDMSTIRISSLTYDEIFQEINSGLIQQQNELSRQHYDKQQTTDSQSVIQSNRTVINGDLYIGKFILSINGQSLEVINNNKILLVHFRFLCFTCRNVVGYNFTAQQKQQLCRLLKRYHPMRPTVLAVGDGFNDALMMQEANIGIEVLNRGRSDNNKLQPQVNAGDIIVSQLVQIQDLLINEGKNQSELTYRTINYLFYYSILIGMTLFYFNWFCAFQSTSMHDSMILFVYNYFFILPNLIVYSTQDNITDPYVNLIFPALYIDGSIRKKYGRLNFIVFIIIISLLVSTLIFYSTYLILQQSIDIQGRTAGLQFTSVVIMFSIVIIANAQMIISMLSRGKKSILISTIITIIFIIIFIFQDYQAKFSYWNYNGITQQIFQRFDSIVAIFINFMIGYFVPTFFSLFLQLHFYPSVYEQTAAQNEGGDSWQGINNNLIRKDCINRQLEITKVVKSVFTNVTYISPYIQEMLNPGDTQVTETKLNIFTLRMKELLMEKKFREDKIQESISFYKFYFGLLLIIFVFFAISSYTMNAWNSYTLIEISVFFSFLLIYIMYIYTTHFRNRYYDMSHYIIGMLVCSKIVVDWLDNSYQISLSAILTTIFATINKTNMNIIPIFFYNICYLIQFLLKIITLSIYQQNNVQIQIQTKYTASRVAVYNASSIIILICTIVFLQLYLYYRAVKQRRNDFIAREQIEQDNNTSQDILSILVPKFVQQVISSGVYTMQEAQDDVAILFLYIVDFDNIMEEEGKNVVMMLDQLFRIYDNLCIQHGVQKIETVGYTYMAASGIKACEIGISSHILRTEKTMRLVNLAFDMSRQVVGRRYGKGNQIEIKVGIHVGRVIAGVIGHHKPQFSLIGDPVNQTSRVASTGDVGAITLSEYAFNKAKGQIRYYIKKKKEAKGLGEINTFQVFQERPLIYQQSKVQKCWQNATIKIFEKLKNNEVQQKDVKKERNFLKKFKKSNIIRLQNQITDLNVQEQYIYNSDIRPKSKSQKININYEDEQKQLITEPEEIFAELNQENDYKDNKMILHPHKYFLTFKQEEQEVYNNYLNISIDKNIYFARVGLALLGLIYIILTILIMIVRKLFTNSSAIYILRASFITLLFIIYPFIQLAYKNLCIKIIFYFALLYCAVIQNYQASMAQTNDLTTIVVLELFFIIHLTSNLALFSFLAIITYLAIVLLDFIVTFNASNQISVQYIFYIMIQMILIIIQSYFSIKENILIYNNFQINEEKKIKQLALVSQLLPTHAFLKLRNTSVFKKQDLTDEFHDVTLLFADIKGFTEYSNTQTPEGVVTMLRNLFTEFDKMCQRFDVYKVYTIGDCYVVMGFTNSAKRNKIQEAINTVQLGMAMVDIIRDVRIKINFKGLDMRIGIHTGSIIGGIIGTEIVRYDIYGKDVSIANKMESNGEVGHVMISDTTKELIDRGEQVPFLFNKIKDVDIPKFGVTYGGWIVQNNPYYVKENIQVF